MPKGSAKFGLPLGGYFHTANRSDSRTRWRTDSDCEGAECLLKLFGHRARAGSTRNFAVRERSPRCERFMNIGSEQGVGAGKVLRGKRIQLATALFGQPH